jgi:hypothetical protein
MSHAEHIAGQGSAPGRGRGPERRQRLLVLAVFLVITVAYVASVPGELHVKPDTMVYLGLARSLVRGEGYTYNFGPYAKYPPGLPLMLAAVGATVGEAARIRVMQTLVALAGVGALAAAYALVKARAGWRVALAGAALSAASTWFWTSSSVYLLAEVPYALLSLLALWGAERAARAATFSVPRWLLAGALTAAAVLTHVVGVALLVAMVAGVLTAKTRARSLRQRLLAAGLAGGMGLAVAVYWWVRGQGLPEMATYSGHVREKAGELRHAGEQLKLRLREYTAAPLSLSYHQVTGSVGGAVFALLLLPGLVEGFRRTRSCAEFYVCVQFVAAALMGGEGGHERYAVPVVPLLFYYGALSLRSVTGWLATELEHRRRQRGDDVVAPSRWPQWVVGGAMAAILVTSGVSRVRGKRGAWPFSAQGRAGAARLLTAWEEAGRWARESIPASAVVCAGSGGSWCVAHYFTERTVEPILETRPSVREVIASLVAWRADFVLADQRDFTKERLWPTLETHPECFDLLAHNDECTLFRVNQAKLAEVHAHLQRQGKKG